MWKQPVVVQNLSGGAGNVAASAVAQATANGYTLLFAAHPVLAVNPLLYQKLPFDPDRDFRPIVLLSKMPHVLLASPALPATTVRELSHSRKRARVASTTVPAVQALRFISLVSCSQILPEWISGMFLTGAVPPP